MMPYKADVKRNYSSGQQTNRIPLNIKPDAFVSLFNAYVWRGRIKKKKGVQKLGRLRRDLSAIDLGNSGASPWSFNIYTTASPVIGAGETNKDLVPKLSTGPVIAITFDTVTWTDNGDGTLTASVDPVDNYGTINYATGDITITHIRAVGVATTADVSYYPGLSAMGLPNKDLLQIDQQELIGFDTKYAYIYSNATGRFKETPSTLATTWSGSDSQFFWTENAYSALFATNDVAGLQGYAITGISNAASAVVNIAGHDLAINDYVQFINVGGMTEINGLVGKITAVVAGVSITVNINSTAFSVYSSGGVAITSIRNLHGDGIRWYDDVSWINFNPAINPVTALMGAGIIVFYRGRIVVLDTLEGNSLTPTATRYPQRARWSKNGTPFVMEPVPTGSNIGTDSEAWREDVVGKGGYIDCPTTQEIVGACFLRDTLIVGFEQSTWKLRYTNNEVLPFVWERLDVEIGWSGRFSGLKFDKFVFGVGNRGITACDGIGVQRIDLDIPDEVFQFGNENSGPERIYGARDYEEHVVYWTFPNAANAGTYPNQVLIYNYLDATWAKLGDSFTCYGYWQSFNDLRWSDLPYMWQDYAQPWNSRSGVTLNPLVISGNQNGFVQIVQNIVANDPTLKVNSITVAAGLPTELEIVRHNLQSDQLILLSGFLGDNVGLNGQIVQVEVVDADNVKLFQYNATTGTYDEFTQGSANYIGNGYCSLIDNFQILTKKFNPFIDDAVSVRVSQIDFYVDATSKGRFAVNIYANDNNNVPANPTDSTNPLSNRLTTYSNAYEPQGQDKLWHTCYNSATGNMFSVELTYGDQELNDQNIFSSEIVVHSIAPHVQPASRRLT